jgi:hypothetical protein
MLKQRPLLRLSGIGSTPEPFADVTHPRFREKAECGRGESEKEVSEEVLHDSSCCQVFQIL